LLLNGFEGYKDKYKNTSIKELQEIYDEMKGE